MLEKITPLILTYNEAPNIQRTLQQLTWAKTIVVIDSYSTDETLEILDSIPQLQVFQRKFDSFAAQCNYGLGKIESEWVLSLDADYVLTDELISEIQTLQTSPDLNSYSVRFKYCIFGKPLHGTLLPPRKVLYKREKATYQDDGHAHRVIVDGKSAILSAYIHHDDRKPLNRWLWAQDRYMIIEVKKLTQAPKHELSLGDKIRKQKIIAPFIILFYCLILKGGIFDGWHGWYYAFQRMLAETLLSIRLIEFEKLQKQ
ncbi:MULTISPECIES: glycosyltransferase family 2 protein [unclassified Moorena]|uniref:glycosyltransferase family 2 protein n=1 Tax=unclassified Moorena TaxID=2683338 RepID=UPI0013C23661|nr:MULTISPECIES: glycosyltransferase family 2 protein [unclassified Moorena]NEO08581.1 glycosyltransferase family 2 protein [Moorena sp. SIO3I8]NEP22359.1 glycosyltransferase family 2 protein [Moorena sp. SIO3I6]NEQ58155.1 glycosyltransferase family 2 protein [Moorena sp. SIO4A1]